MGLEVAVVPGVGQGGEGVPQRVRLEVAVVPGLDPTESGHLPPAVKEASSGCTAVTRPTLGFGVRRTLNPIAGILLRDVPQIVAAY